MKLYGLGVVVGLFVLLVPAQAGPRMLTPGTYSCAGKQEGHVYTLSLVIQERGNTYELAWSAAHGHPKLMAGLGVPDGNHLAVAIVSPNGGMGVAHYTITPGRLDGVWTNGNGAIETEVCTSGRVARVM